MENPVKIKNQNNRRTILKTLYFDGPLSNTEIGKKLKLSLPKILSLLGELRSENLITEIGQGVSSGGRRPNLVGLSANAFYLFGVSIGFEQTKIALIDSQNQLVGDQITLDLNVYSGQQVFEEIKLSIDQLVLENQIPIEKIFSIGMEMPGIIDSAKKKNHSYFDGIELSSLDLKFGYPVYFENDTKVQMFWEYRFGTARGLKNALLVHIDHGIGLGMLLKGKLYTGKNGFAGEFGHLPISDNGKLCTCGKKGCLETVASTIAITSVARNGIKEGITSIIAQLADNDLSKINITLIIQAAAAGDHFAISILSEASQWLGRGVAYLIQIFNPERIILSGRVAQAGNLILPPIQLALNSYANPAIVAETDLVISQQNQEGSIIGAAALAFYKLYIP